MPISLRWGILLLGLCIAVIVPFLIWGEQIERWTDGFLDAARQRPLLAASVIFGLLAADIVLPVPSSILSTAAGAIHGFLFGSLISFAGLTATSVAGYAVGAGLGRSAVGRWLGTGEDQAVRRAWGRLGDAVVVIMRPVPVLAEASVVLAGVGRMPLRRFVVLVSLANLGISIVYAAVGAWAAAAAATAEGWGFLLAFLAALALPGVAMLIGRLVFPRR